MRHTLSVLVENKFGVLARVAGMFSGRGFNIDTLNVGPTQDSRFSRITATVHGDDQQLDQCIKQLDKLVEVITVNDLQQDQFVARELIMVKINATAQTRPEIIQICDIFKAKILDVGKSALIAELTGDHQKLESFIGLVESYGILELARTGQVALERQSAYIEKQDEAKDNNAG